MNYKKKGAGILLWDAICAITLILIALSAGVFGYHEYLNTSRGDVVRSDLVSLCGAVSQYHYEMDKYPDNLDDLTKAEGQYGPWLDEIKKDPWNRDYCFEVSDDGKRFVVYSTMEKGNAKTPDVNNPKANSNTGNYDKCMYIIGH